MTTLAVTRLEKACLALNLDWGQELVGLKKWMDRSGVKEIVLGAMWAPAPEIYGIRAVHPGGVDPRPDTPAYLAIGATDLAKYLYGDDRRAEEVRSALDQAVAIDTIGYSLMICRVTQPLPKGFP